MKSWLMLGASLLIAAAGLGWMSRMLIRFDRAAVVSENTRLALWRMDFALARLMTAESTRSPADYQPGSLALERRVTPGVLLHFDVAPDGITTTPQQGQEERLAHLRPLLQQVALPAAPANAVDGSRNSGEFNRRNAFAMNNLAPPEREASAAAMVPTWFGDALVLVRRVPLRDGLHLQGAWLDWESLRPSLLREVKDLLPFARLEPVSGVQRGDPLMLASLPVRLVPGAPAENADPERTPIWGVISAAWAALVLVFATLGALLFGTLALDARRAAFVSAVTHELRTPLTTFKLYAEMLDEGMLPPRKQKEYLRTLRQEANRLGYLVENVLAYAHIEKGRRNKPLEVLSCSGLMNPIIPRLEARAQLAQIKLEVGAIPDQRVKADRVCVEQILFNLVDNACKHAPGAQRLTLGFALSKDRLTLSVSDDGPGVSVVVERKLFEPMRKSAYEAADGAQGIGLGLALSRRLARAMGGDLRYRRASGALFELSLERVTQA